MQKKSTKRNYYQYLLYTLLFIVLLTLLTSIFSFIILNKKNEMKEGKGMQMTAFDIALAKKFMDKNNDGICDACGMSVDQCIQGGMMECSMAPGARIGTLGSTHAHALFRVYENGQALDFNNEKYFVKSMFIHIEEDPNSITGRKLHIHATGIPLSLFFDSLEMNRSKYHLFVNGKKIAYEGYVPADGDWILLTNSPDEKIQEELKTVS